MIIENPEYREEVTHYSWGDHTDVHVVLPKGMPSENGAIIVMINNLDYFMQTFGFDGDAVRFLRPYEILADLEERVLDDVLGKGEIETSYLVSYKRKGEGDAIFLFSCFEVNSESEPDERYRSLYINFEFNGSVS